MKLYFVYDNTERTVLAVTKDTLSILKESENCKFPENGKEFEFLEQLTGKERWLDSNRDNLDYILSYAVVVAKLKI